MKREYQGKEGDKEEKEGKKTRERGEGERR